jgi:hypothetical protein
MTVLPDVYTVTTAHIAKGELRSVWAHLQRPGAVVRVVHGTTGGEMGWIYPPDHAPPGYRGSALDDTARIREWAAAQRSQRAATASRAKHQLVSDGQARD